MKKVTVCVIALMLSVGLLAIGCSDEDGPNTDKIGSALKDLEPGDCVPLYAGKSIDAGNVCIDVEGDYYTLTYSTGTCYALSEVHAWVGHDLELLPATRAGNPMVGHFPYKAHDLEGEKEYTIQVPKSEFGDELLHVAAHASLVKDADFCGTESESAWGAGERIVDKGNWATYFSANLNGQSSGHAVEVEWDACLPPEGFACETAFAWGETTFIDLKLTKKRWGWQIGPIYPMAPGQQSMRAAIYAGAGQNDIDKGTYVGNLYVYYDGYMLDVYYGMWEYYSMSETHLYVGVDPVDTVAPGQYGNVHYLDDVLSDRYRMYGFDGSPIYIVAHADVCAIQDDELRMDE